MDIEEIITMLPLTREEANTVYSEILAGLMIAEKECEKSNDTELIPKLMIRVVNLVNLEARLRPLTSYSFMGVEKDSTRSGVRREPQPGKDWR